MNKYNFLDLFAGCGGLSDGFEKTKKYSIIGAVEWEKKPINTLINRMEKRWEIKDAKQKCLHFDMQRTEELLNGWVNDPIYGNNKGLLNIVGNKKIDIIIGGPPCQAYSVAGRIRDENGMHNDYRNYLFESYIKIVNQFKPKIFVFENVPGLLSAKPEGIDIKKIIKKEFEKIGYEIINDLKIALVNAEDYGIPQKRTRVIIIGVNKESFINYNIQDILHNFYNKILVEFKENKKTVKDAIKDLTRFYPLEASIENKKMSHFPFEGNIPDHNPRFHNKRDIEIFRELAMDIEKKIFKYNKIEEVHKIYTEKTGKTSNVHKYYVLKWLEQSNTIVAHLHKDGLRHIHPDPKQARSITIREAARLQTFDDDFEFCGCNGDKYKMIGNAVPPKLANKIAEAIFKFLNIYKV